MLQSDTQATTAVDTFPNAAAHVIGPEMFPVVLITGGSQGLGRALAKTLLQSGFAVVLCARTHRDVQATRQALQAYGPLLALTGDIVDDDFRSRLIEETIQTFGRLDAVVNNASTLGTLPLPQVLESSPGNIRRVFSINVEAPIDLLRKALPHLAGRDRSLVVGISSDAAVGGYATWGIYGASKAALDLLHKTMASELQPHHIHVHALDPGDMATQMHHDADPTANGLVDPAIVADAMLPLFYPLLHRAEFPFVSGGRLQVSDGHLREAVVS